MKAGTIYFSFALFFLYFTVPTTTAQSTLSMGLSYARPAKDLATADYRQGFGFYMETMSRGIETRLPIDLQFGGRFNMNIHGEERIETYLLTPFEGPGEYTLSNQSVGLSGITRLITPAHHRFRVYLDGFVGSSVFYASESLAPTEDHPDFDSFDECNSSEVVQRSWAFHYGASAGFMVRVAPTTRLDIRTTYTRGSNIGFVNLNSLQQVEQNAFNYTTSRSALDMLQFQIGVNFDIIESCGGSSSSDNWGYSGFSSCGN